MRNRFAAAVLAMTIAVLLPVPTAASAAPSSSGAARGCERKLERMIDEFDRAFLERRLDDFMTYYDDDAVKILTSGTLRAGTDAIRAGYVGLFAVEFVATFPIVAQTVNGCRTAVVVTDFRLSIPERNVTSHFLNTLTLTYAHGRWVVVADQSTTLPGA